MRQPARLKESYGDMPSANKTISVVVVLVALVVAATSCYYSYSAEDITDKAIQDTSKIYLKELAEQKENQVQINLTSQVQQLDVTGKTLRQDDLASEESLQAYVGAMEEANDFDFFGLVDANGMIHTSTDQFSGISRFSFLSESFTEPVVAFDQNIQNTNLVIITVPLEGYQFEGVPITAMIASTKVDTIAQKISLYDDNTATYCGVVKSNGSYVMKSNHAYTKSASNFLSIMEQQATFEKGFSFEQMKESLSNGQAIFEEYSLNGMRHFTYLAPIEGTDWFVEATIHYDTVSGGVNTVRTTLNRNNLVRLAIVVSALICSFLFYLRMCKRQEHSRLAQIKAEESNRAKSDFLSQMSHDIRTPMNAVIGFTELAMKEEDVPPKVHDYHLKIRTAGEQLLMLINDVLEMSHIESGKIKLKESACELSSVLSGVRVVIEERAKAKKLSLHVDVDVTDGYVYCDQMRLGQILLNLMANAVKFTPEGESVRVKLNQIPCDEEGYGLYEIEVADNGIGMSPEFAEKLFTPFERERTSTESGIEGTGLGLAIAKSMVDAMGGTIDVQTEPGKGTSFTVQLKFRLVEQDVIAEIERERAPENPSEGADVQSSNDILEGKHVLLVEDNAFNREVARMLLEDAGVVVTDAEDGSIAVEKVMQTEPGTYDLILMDIQMPGMNGYEATQAIRALDDERASIKIIAVTADAFEEDQRAAQEAGMDAHISKPIHAERLRTLMRQLL